MSCFIHNTHVHRFTFTLLLSPGDNMYSCERCKKWVCVVNPALTCSDTLKSNHCYFSHAFIDTVLFCRLRNGVKYCKVLKLPEVHSFLSNLFLAADKFGFACVCLHEVPMMVLMLFWPCVRCLDSLHPPETIPARGHVLVQDQQPRVLPAGGPRHATLPGQREPIPSHNLWSAVSYLSSWHGRKYDFSFISSIKIQLPFPLFCRIAESNI